MGGCASKPKESNGEAEAPVQLEESPVVSDPTVRVNKAAATGKAEKSDGTFRKSLGVLFKENEENNTLCEAGEKDPAATPELKLDVEAETPKLQEDGTEDLEAEPHKIQEHTAEALEHKAEPPNVEEHLDLETKAETPKIQEHTSEALEPKPEPPTEILEPKADHSSDVIDPNLVVAEEKSAEPGAKAEVQPVEEVAVAATKKKEGVASFFLKQIMAKNFLVK